jgi:hypothetical protein
LIALTSQSSPGAFIQIRSYRCSVRSYANRRIHRQSVAFLSPNLIPVVSVGDALRNINHGIDHGSFEQQRLKLLGRSRPKWHASNDVRVTRDVMRWRRSGTGPLHNVRCARADLEPTRDQSTPSSLSQLSFAEAKGIEHACGVTHLPVVQPLRIAKTILITSTPF